MGNSDSASTRMKRSSQNWLTTLREGVAIPASPLALDAKRRLDERRQRALFRYYAAAGVGGIAVGVHTTQFAIRDPKTDLFYLVLEIGRQEMNRADAKSGSPLIRVAGVCGKTKQAASEATLIRDLGYHAGLLSLAAMRDATEKELLAHCRAVAEIIPVIGFYLQPAVGGRVLPFSFWRQFAEIKNVVAIKMAPFNRYQTIDVVRAVVESGRDDIALYTGNDDNIVLDLLTPYRFLKNGKPTERRIVGGLLGHWSVWTRAAVQLLAECQAVARSKKPISAELLRRNVEVTDCNAAFFDSANQFAGCIAGLHEVLRRQGLLEGIWCLDRKEKLSPGQAAEIDRVYRAYPHLNDDAFVAKHREKWLR
ncbi:MAG: dihydrodipicolinate synthase/N-acetylneuraminate lyase [Verrucomicrobiales bacterium]|nr:dihydrodipicolinate synthase/N-acetylneuraminate lyase [Verrucomicrobiales bacterium]